VVKLGDVLWLHAVEEFLSLSSTHTHTREMKCVEFEHKYLW